MRDGVGMWERGQDEGWGSGCGKEVKMRDGVGMLETGQGEGWGRDVGKRSR